MSKSAWVKTNHLPPQKEALLTRKNGTKNFARFGKNGKKGNTSKGITFSPENVHPDEPFHLNCPRNYRVSIQMDWEYWQQSMRRKTREICILQFASTGCFQYYSETYYLRYYNLIQGI